MTAELANGSKLNLDALQSNPARLHTADIPIGPISWLRHNVGAPSKAIVILTSEEQDSLAQGVRDYVLAGRVVTLRPEVLGAMPLSAGSQLNSNGTQTRITRLDRLPGDVKLEVMSLGIGTPDGRSMSVLPSNERLTFALVNARSAQGLVLAQNGSGGGGDWLVLPGAPVNQSSFQLESAIPKIPAEQVGDLSEEWYRGANLVVARWEIVGSYRTTIHTGGGD